VDLNLVKSCKLKGQFRHGDVRLCFDAADQKAPVTSKFAPTRGAALPGWG
jgi:hypothetical protein